MIAPSFDTLLYDVSDGGVATITLDQPDNRNALTHELLGDLLAALEAARGDDAVRCVVLTSSHERVFSSGGNLEGFRADVPVIRKHFDYTGLLPQLFLAIAGFPKPTLCAANGHVLAGALGVAIACDLILAKESVRFGTPEINIGAFPFMIMALIYRNVPRKTVNEMLLLGERMSAREAREAGIVNRVVPDDEFDGVVADWSAKLASKSPTIMRLGKEAMFRQADMPLDEALEYLRAQLALAFATEDLIEGVTAFFEKRDPIWKGR